MKKRVKKELSFDEKISSLIIAGVVMALGLALFKFIPMEILGNEILFDASMHITLAIFLLYILWYFIDQNKGWRIPYFIFSFVVIAVVSLQRVVAGNHNDIGLLLGFLISMLAVIISRWGYFRDKFSF